MRTAAAYIRVSTDGQLEYSPDSQLKVIRDYAQKHDFLLPEAYIFREEEGISGKEAKKRPAFMRMIGIAKQKPKPFDCIILGNSAVLRAAAGTALSTKPCCASSWASTSFP